MEKFVENLNEITISCPFEKCKFTIKGKGIATLKDIYVMKDFFKHMTSTHTIDQILWLVFRDQIYNELRNIALKG